MADPRYSRCMTDFQRHIRACNNATLPGGRTPFRLGGTQVGWLQPALAEQLTGFPAIVRTGDAVTLNSPADLPAIARAVAARGFGRHRGEAFDVRATPGGPALSTIDRGALPAFGIMAEGIHLNGLVRRPDGLHAWVAKRAADKALDPGKLDHIVAGGIPAGMTPLQTLIKEAAEEAAIPAATAATARPVGTLGYAMARPEGLRRDVLHCYDLDLPEDFCPLPTDGEVESFSLWPIHRVLEAVRDTDDFKFNVNVVLIDLFIRQELIGMADAAALRAAMAK